MPIVAGIMLQPNFNGLKRIAGLCGASPAGLAARALCRSGRGAETRELVTANVAAELCQKLGR